MLWGVIHLRRNERIRRGSCDCDRLQARISNILRYSRDVLFGFDVCSGTFDFLSPSCLSLTGYTVDEIKAMPPQELLAKVHPEDEKKIAALIEQLRRNKKEQDWQGPVDCRVLHRDGEYRSFSGQLHILYDPAGSAVFLGGSVRDVTASAQMEESMRVLEKKFHDSQKMAGLGLLASGIAHDFNNLMTVVLGNAELSLLEHGGSDGGVLDEIKKTALRAAELANQMLVYTGKASGAVSQSVNLSSVVKEMASLLDVSISKKVSIKYCLAKDTPTIRGEISQLRQVAMNLITNASEAIGDRPGVIAINIHGVDLKAGDLGRTIPPGGLPSGPYVMLEVSDTGEGMSEETMQRIFDPLFTTKITGRGLGLASLLNVVKRHNGAVEVKSKLGHGTVFRIYFPAETEGTEASEESAPVVVSTWRGSGTVLVADDEAAIREVTRILLERFGFRVIMAVDGLEAVDLYKEHAGDISLILIDINMPKLSGTEAVLRIRHISPAVPVLFMSGYPREQIMERFGKDPHTEFVKKPFQSSDLLEGIRAVIETRRS